MAGGGFCTRCGTQFASATDGFCASCGAPRGAPSFASGVAAAPPGSYGPGPTYGSTAPPPPPPPGYGYQPYPPAPRYRFVDPDTGRPLAEWWKRAVAYLLDGMILAIPLWILEVVTIGFLGATAAGPEQCNQAPPYGCSPTFNVGAFFAGFAVFWLVSVVLQGTYFVLLIGSSRGQTVGMMALGIAVRDADQERSIGYGRACVRYLVIWGLGLFCGLPVLIDFLSPLWDRRRQAWHDHAARSVVTDLR